MKKVLIGVIMNGKAGGVDKYLLDFFESVGGENCRFDFLTNSTDPELRDFLASKNAGLIEFPRVTAPVAQYKFVKALVEKEKYDAVYLNISTALQFLAAAAARKGGVEKVIVHSHSSAFDVGSNLKKRIMTAIHRICKIPLCRYATDFCSCSHKASEWMFTKKIVNSGKIKMVYNAVTPENFLFSPEKRDEMRKSLGLENSFVVGHIGNFLSSKNHTFLIDIFDKLLIKAPESKLLLIGDGDFFEQIKDKVRELNISSSVIFAGRQSNANDYLQAMDIFVLPSRFEGLPIVSVEAQVNGLPVLLSDRISREAKIMNSCEFVGIESADAWVEKILEYKNYSRSNTRVVNTEYIYDKRKMKDVYKSIIGG